MWPVATWATYRDDRDTAGEGYSWMLWPLYGQVRRERESQDLFLPPFQREGSSPEERSKAILDSYTFLAQEIAKEYNVNLELGTTVTLPPESGKAKKGNDFWASIRFCIAIRSIRRLMRM